MASDYTSVRMPIDLNEKLKVLAAVDGTSIQEWCNTRFRKFVEREYQRVMEREARRAELGNPVG